MYSRDISREAASRETDMKAMTATKTQQKVRHLTALINHPRTGNTEREAARRALSRLARKASANPTPEPVMPTTRCWNCPQPATHVFTRQGSNTLDACDNCTHMDRETAEASGWTIARTLANRAPRAGSLS
ncbi:hypothetical protein [Actinacidiphila sp. ITFR-21]|uniref:hypothetical protein n=1 Tax=Actinacidiphila sp. ITFR-21 TaxID=3075199 RepID=UPI00288BECF5|nr:hypothetical protein [Streptomyces sp. ITFR-21]WNI19229.1 hypothetical protein RLT57_29240 [Streptomyces sp. ITFR-21]